MEEIKPEELTEEKLIEFINYFDLRIEETHKQVLSLINSIKVLTDKVERSSYSRVKIGVYELESNRETIIELKEIMKDFVKIKAPIKTSNDYDDESEEDEQEELSLNINNPLKKLSYVG